MMRLIIGSNLDPLFKLKCEIYIQKEYDEIKDGQ